MKSKITLLAALFLFIILSPFFESNYFGLIPAALLALIVISTILYSFDHKIFSILLVFFGVASILLIVAANYTPERYLQLSSAISSALFFGILYYFTKRRFLSGEFQVKIIPIGVSAFLALGLFFGAAFSFVEISQPGSIFVSEYHDLDGVVAGSDFTYFSFSILTRLGFGDITPVSSAARVLVVLESIFGLLFIAFFIARLLGFYLPEPVFLTKRKRKRRRI